MIQEEKDILRSLALAQASAQGGVRKEWSEMGWPQAIWLATEIAGVCIHAMNHGETKRREYNLFARLIVAGLNLWILNAGGFFG